MSEETGTIAAADGTPVAWRRRAGAGDGRPGLVFCGGFRSAMAGEKATFLDGLAADRGLAFLRFDYRGHGISGGVFPDLVLGDWIADALAAVDTLTAGPQILVGSSMGAWVATCAAVARPDRIAGLVGIAAAPDFTEDLMLPALGEMGLARMRRDGFIDRPSAYGDGPYRITWRLIQEARSHLLLRGPVPFAGPARLLHGLADPDVPWRQSLRLTEALAGADVRLTLVKDGDHRLSRPQDLALLGQAVTELVEAVSGR
ncbi:pimeloyl-ACP methyl ester carboxylesterase [Inquilinus ginsengisoli]|uniref:Palmitoyl-protein thioesterase ABHD10, mitochondrial n=1 Tax=Inquilinus ginsengisoli TaxID=363840 RepID=A0ABU1JUY1_9PROT|nr:alpha/beta fold hydrolase [Inquilinus ginsengisoli]MDR6292103.1 pimeloyl-ACP methyl ester carboxylesterase [Inquilinus ginsengisoli]